MRNFLKYRFRCQVSDVREQMQNTETGISAIFKSLMKAEILHTNGNIYHYLKHLQRFRFISEFRTEKLCVTLRKLCVTLRLKSARQNYQNVLSIGIQGILHGIHK